MYPFVQPSYIDQENRIDTGRALTRDVNVTLIRILSTMPPSHFAVDGWGAKILAGPSPFFCSSQISDVIIGLLCVALGRAGSNIHFLSDKSLQLKLDPFPLGRRGYLWNGQKDSVGLLAGLVWSPPIILLLLLSRAQLPWQWQGPYDPYPAFYGTGALLMPFPPFLRDTESFPGDRID